MVDLDQLALLKQGVDVWNTWRSKNPDVGLVLPQADLRCAGLRGADLSGANLIEADLSEAFLSGANLSGAFLIEVDLSGVQNLTIEQLCAARTLHGVTGLAPNLMEQIKEQCPDLLEEPKEEG